MYILKNQGRSYICFCSLLGLYLSHTTSVSKLKVDTQQVDVCSVLLSSNNPSHLSSLIKEQATKIDARSARLSLNGLSISQKIKFKTACGSVVYLGVCLFQNISTLKKLRAVLCVCSARPGLLKRLLWMYG